MKHAEKKSLKFSTSTKQALKLAETTSVNARGRGGRAAWVAGEERQDEILGSATDSAHFRQTDYIIKYECLLSAARLRRSASDIHVLNHLSTLGCISPEPDQFVPFYVLGEEENGSFV